MTDEPTGQVPPQPPEHAPTISRRRFFGDGGKAMLATLLGTGAGITLGDLIGEDLGENKAGAKYAQALAPFRQAMQETLITGKPVPIRSGDFEFTVRYVGKDKEKTRPSRTTQSGGMSV